MSSPQNETSNRFSKIAQQGQEAVTGAVRTWAEAVQRLSGQQGNNMPDVSAVVDNAFDLAERLLATQREFTKSVLQAVATGTGSAADATAETINRAAEQGAQSGAGATDAASRAAEGSSGAARQGGEAMQTAAQTAQRAGNESR